jgi:hypothetical protein
MRRNVSSNMRAGQHEEGDDDDTLCAAAHNSFNGIGKTRLGMLEIGGLYHTIAALPHHVVTEPSGCCFRITCPASMKKDNDSRLHAYLSTPRRLLFLTQHLQNVNFYCRKGTLAYIV